MIKSDVADDGTLWKDVGEKIHSDADKLFKIIGEAYTILSDSFKVLHSLNYIILLQEKKKPETGKIYVIFHRLFGEIIWPDQLITIFHLPTPTPNQKK